MKIWVLIGVFLLTGVAGASAEEACGDEGLSCGAEEHCCEHVVAMFSDDHAVGPAYVQGACLPKAQKCNSFWCGNRQCSAGFFGSPSVCCVNTPPAGGSSEYSCAYSELNCPGNTEQLSIRETQPARSLRRG